HLANKISFKILDGKFPHELEALFPAEKSYPQKELIDAGRRGLYTKVQLDSSVEQNFVEKVLKREEDDIILYFKFPPNFKVGLPKITTNYNPYWGIVRKNDDGTMKLELVRETKGTDELAKLRFTSEGRKITCAIKYFKQLGIDYRPIKWDQKRWWAPADS